MTTISSPAASTPAVIRRDRRPAPASYVTVRVLTFVVGVFGATAATYFGFVLSADDGGISNGFDLFVTLWKIGLSVAFVVAAAAPGLSRTARVAVARWAMGAELVFDAIKLGYYHETAALVFTAIDCLIVALVLRAGRAVREG
jgi:hypothetical protein